MSYEAESWPHIARITFDIFLPETSREIISINIHIRRVNISNQLIMVMRSDAAKL